MAGFIYFVPNEDKLQAQAIALREVPYALEAGQMTPARVPGAKPPLCPGTIFGAKSSISAGLLKVDLEKQVWRNIPGTSGMWVGYWKDNPPKPDDLKREKQLGGQWIAAENGSQWLAPVARYFSEFDGEIFWSLNMPASRELDEDGKWQRGDVKPRYQRLWKLATQYHDLIIGGTDDESNASRFEFDLDDLAVECLQTNYLIGPAELSLLGIYDDDFANRLAKILIDLDNWLALLKKKRDTSAAEIGVGSSGPAASTPEPQPTTPQL